MPELPEVETVRRGLEPVLMGHRLVRVDVRRPNLRFAFPDRFSQRLEGQLIVRLERRAKYILAHLEGGETLIVHLGMTGRFTIQRPESLEGDQPGTFTHAAGANQKHDHVVLHTAAGVVVTYNDARRFGYMDLADTAALATHPLMSAIGIEPLSGDLTPVFLADAARGRRADLKAFLMDQRIVAGLGNIYVCEALHRARLSPVKPAARIATPSGKPKPEAARLITVIRDVLLEAIEAGGSTLRDFQKTDGTLGYFQKSFAVYGREHEPCVSPGCNGRIERIVQANRSTFFCPVCQRG
jgi:formamidopyrimidine-DNA glycosylase